MRYQITKDNGVTWIDLQTFGEESFDYNFEIGEIGNIDNLRNPTLFTEVLPYSPINQSALEYSFSTSNIFNKSTYPYRITRNGVEQSAGEIYVEGVDFNNDTPVFRVQFRDYISLVIEKLKEGDFNWSDLYTDTFLNTPFYFKNTYKTFPYGSSIQLPYQDMLGDGQAGLDQKRFVMAPKVTKESATPIPWLPMSDFISRVFSASGYGISADSPILNDEFRDLAIGIPAQLKVSEDSSDSPALFVSNREMNLTPFYSVVYDNSDISWSGLWQQNELYGCGGGTNYSQRTDDNNNTEEVYDRARPTNFKNGMVDDGEKSEGFNISTYHKNGNYGVLENDKFPVIPRNHIQRPFAQGGFEAVVGGFTGQVSLGTTEATGSSVRLELELFNLDLEGMGAVAAVNPTCATAADMTHCITTDLDLDAMDSAGTRFKFYTELYEDEYPVQRIYWNAGGYQPDSKVESGGIVKDCFGDTIPSSSITANTLVFNLNLDGQLPDPIYINGMTQYRTSIGCEVEGPIIARGKARQYQRISTLDCSSAASVSQSNLTGYVDVTVGGSTTLNGCAQVKSRIQIKNEEDNNFVERVGIKITPSEPYRASTPNDKTDVVESLDLSEYSPYDIFEECAKRFRLNFILDNSDPLNPEFLVGRIDDIIANVGNADKNLEQIVDNRLPISVDRGIQSIANVSIINKENNLEWDMSGSDPNITVGSYEGPIYSYSGGVIQDPLTGTGELKLDLEGAIFREDLSSDNDNTTKEREDLSFDMYETYTSLRINPDIEDIGIRFAYLNENTTDTIGTWFAQYHTFWLSTIIGGGTLVYAKNIPQYKLWEQGTGNEYYTYYSSLSQTKANKLELRVTHPAILGGKPSGFYDYVVNSIMLQRNAAPTVRCKILLPQNESNQRQFALRRYTSNNIHGSLYLVALEGTNYEEGLYADATFVVLDL
jgi:hypothetical protein